MARATRQRGKAVAPAKGGDAVTPGEPHLDTVSDREAKEAVAEAKAGPVTAIPAPAVPADDGGPPPRAGSATPPIRMGSRAFAAAPTALAGRKLDILPDLLDIRDRLYQPHLRALRASIYPAIAFEVRDQGPASSCTGHALAHVIDCLMHREMMPERPRRVSARMLYEMAKRNDEWTGTAYEGSSVRGAVSGLYRNGVCSEVTAPDEVKGEWALTYLMAKEARDTRIGAYYRVQPDLSDYHAALNEIGVIYASAQIHAGWDKPAKAHIAPGGQPVGGHAFAIVGYDSEGFWVLNSWGAAWGEEGVAHWRYEDWAATVMDAWVLQLGVRAPNAFSAIPRAVPANAATPTVSPAPNRSDIVGHFINIDDGRYITGGRYGSPTAPEMAETVERLANAKSNDGAGYDHLVIYAHGGLNTLDDEARRIATWKRRDIFGRNGLYNFHLMWGSGFLDEAFGQLSTTQGGRAAGFVGDLVFETGFGKALGSAAWRNMKQDAVAAFTEDPEYDGGMVGLAPLFQGLEKAKKRPVLHLVGHSAGAIMLGRLLGALGRFGLKKMVLGSVHLMAPACTVEFFNALYGPYLKGGGAVPLADKLYLYNLHAGLELADTVGVGGLPGYGRSLLHLVSRAYEDKPNTPLAGMEMYAAGLGKPAKLSIDYALGPNTASTSHGGFDNDAATLTAIMRRVRGGKVPPKPPTPDELVGY